MEKYKVLIRKSVETVITIVAEDKTTARELAEEKALSGEVDFTGGFETIEAIEPEKIK